jgi:hypothetical protein
MRPVDREGVLKLMPDAGHKDTAFELTAWQKNTCDAVAWNESGFSNAEFDSLLEQAMGIANVDVHPFYHIYVHDIHQKA